MYQILLVGFSYFVLIQGSVFVLRSFDIVELVAVEFSQQTLLHYHINLCGLGRSGVKNLQQPHLSPCLQRSFKNRFEELYGASVDDYCELVANSGWVVSVFRQGEGRRDDNWYFKVSRRDR